MSMMNGKPLLTFGAMVFAAVGLMVYVLWPSKGQSVQSSGSSDPEVTQIQNKQTITTQFTDLNAQIELIYTALQHQTEQITQYQTHLKQYQQALIERLTVQDEHIDQIGTMIAKLKTKRQVKLRQNEKRQAHKIRHIRRKPKARITLASIDQWGDESVAVLQDQTSLVSLRTGDQYQNWEMTNIDVDQQTVTLVKPNQKQLILRVHQ